MSKSIGSLRTVSGNYEVFLVKIEDVDLSFQFDRERNEIEVRKNGEMLLRELSLSEPVHREFELAGKRRVFDLYSHPPDSKLSKIFTLSIRIDGIPVSGTVGDPITRVMGAKKGLIAVISLLSFRGLSLLFFNLWHGNMDGAIGSFVLYLILALGGTGLLFYFPRNMRTSLWLGFGLAIAVLIDHSVGLIMLLSQANRFDATVVGQIFGFVTVASVEIGIISYVYRGIRDVKALHARSLVGARHPLKAPEAPEDEESSSPYA